MAEKILYIVETMGGGIFTYIVDLANELVNSYDMYISYAVRRQTPQNYKDYFDKRIHLIEAQNFGRAIDPVKDIAAFFEVKKQETAPTTQLFSVDHRQCESCRKRRVIEENHREMGMGSRL